MYLLFSQVACALLMAGEDLDNHVDVKNILVEMGTYFQVQVLFVIQLTIHTLEFSLSLCTVCHYQLEISFKNVV
jgi:hypothetical protein